MTIGTALRILIVSFVVAVIVYFGVGMMPKTYSSYLSLYFPSMQTSKGGLSALAAVSGGGEGDAGAVNSLRGALVSPLVGSGPQTATGILMSRTCLLEVVQKLGLDDRWKCSKSRAASNLMQKISVKTEKSGFLRIDATTEDPKLSAEIVSAMHNHLMRRSSELSLNVSKRNREFIQNRLKETQGRVEEVRSELVAKLSKSPLPERSELERAYVETRLKWEEATVRQASARQELATLTTALKSLAEKRGGPESLSGLQGMSVGGTSETIGLSLDVLAQQLQERRLELSDAAKRFTKSSAEYQEADRRTKSIEGVVQEILSSETKRLQEGTSPRLAKAQVQLRALEAVVDEYDKMLSEYGRIAKLVPQQSTAAESIRAQFGAALATQSMLQGELEMAMIAEVRDPSRFEVVDPPIEDPEPVGPRKGLITALAFMLACAAQLVPVLAAKPKGAVESAP